MEEKTLNDNELEKVSGGEIGPIEEDDFLIIKAIKFFILLGKAKKSGLTREVIDEIKSTYLTKGKNATIDLINEKVAKTSPELAAALIKALNSIK